VEIDRNVLKILEKISAKLYSGIVPALVFKSNFPQYWEKIGEDRRR
jgi:hypothetical protein